MTRPISTLARHAPCEVPSEFRLITVDPLIWRQHYVSQDLDDTIASFISYSREKGSTSRQWEDTFLGFCDYRHEKYLKEIRDKRDGQDSMGFPLDPVKRLAAEQRIAGPQVGDERYFNSGFWHDRMLVHLGEGMNEQQAIEQATVDHAAEYPITTRSN